jgi:hypothetical protein
MSGAIPPRNPGSITIDRLALEIPGFDPAQVNRLTQLVASHLADQSGQVGDIVIPRLTVTLSARDTGVEQIAWAIARAIRQRGR